MKRNKSYPRITRKYRLPSGEVVTTLRYNIGTCPDATLTNPHNRGTKPETCDRCSLYN